MGKHLLLTGASLLVFGYKRGRNVSWYLNRRLTRPY